MADYTLHLGDCIEVMRTLADNSIDSICTDPPYGIRFMGKAAMLEGFNFIGCDNDKSYLAIAEARILYAQQFAKDESSQLSLI